MRFLQLFSFRGLQGSTSPVAPVRSLDTNGRFLDLGIVNIQGTSGRRGRSRRFFGGSCFGHLGSGKQTRRGESGLTQRLRLSGFSLRIKDIPGVGVSRAGLRIGTHRGAGSDPLRDLSQLPGWRAARSPSGRCTSSAGRRSALGPGFIHGSLPCLVWRGCPEPPGTPAPAP